MNNDDHLLTLKIDAYIKGQLPEVERQAFEKDLQTNVVLADRVRTQRAELVLLEKVAEENLRLKVRKWSAEIDDENNDKPSKKWWQHPLSIFAFLGSIVLAFFLFFNKKTTDTPSNVSPNLGKLDTIQSTQKLNHLPKTDTINKTQVPNAQPKTHNTQPHIQIAKPPIAVVENTTVRNDLLAYTEDIDRATERNDASTPPLSKIVQFVKNQDFITARNALLDISPQVDYYADVQFLLATIDYLDKKPKKAATVFRTLSNIDGYIRKEQALYYFAASLIADGQVIEAKKILSLIAADAEHPKHDAAVVLLKSL